MQPGIPDLYRDNSEAIARIAVSHARLIGEDLITGSAPVTALWDAKPAIVAHGTEPDPTFFFGNRTALELFEATPEQFTALPSRKSAEAPLRAEREALMDRVRANGFIDDYSGIRISLTGRRFRIARAVVWNLLDECGTIHGQAAAFDHWEYLE